MLSTPVIAGIAAGSCVAVAAIASAVVVMGVKRNHRHDGMSKSKGSSQQPMVRRMYTNDKDDEPSIAVTMSMAMNTNLNEKHHKKSGSIRPKKLDETIEVPPAYAENILSAMYGNVQPQSMGKIGSK